MKPISSFLSLSLVACALSMSACGKDKPADVPRPPRVVEVAIAQALPGTGQIELSGVLAFREESRAGFKTGGVVSKIAVREGDVVQAGQLLASLNATEIDAGVAQVQALHEKALRDLRRGESLFAQEVIAQESLDNLRTAERAAKASLQSASFNRGTADIRAAEQSVVIKRLSEAGEVVGPGQPVLLLGSLKSGLVFRAGVNDAQRVRLDARATAQVMLDAWPGEAFAAPVQELGQVADARTGAFRVELAIKPVKDKPVFAGMVGRAQLPSLAGDVSLYSLPLSAVVDIPKGGVTVFVVQADDSVKRETLALAELRKDAVLVRGPLPADTRYVVSGTSFLSEGEVVKVATTTPATVQGIAK